MAKILEKLEQVQQLKKKKILIATLSITLGTATFTIENTNDK